MTNIHETEGSWETRKHTQRWVIEEIEEVQHEGIG